MSDDRPDIRRQLLEYARAFTRAVSQLAGVKRIDLLGSITTDKRDPKDIDLLVVVTSACDLAQLAKSARQLLGRAQALNHGADVFLADEQSNYLGRTCLWKVCAPGRRASCDALHCGRRQYLHDDLNTVTLPGETVAAPPVTLWPRVERRRALPADVETVVAEFERTAQHSAAAGAPPV